MILEALDRKKHTAVEVQAMPRFRVLNEAEQIELIEHLENLVSAIDAIFFSVVDDEVGGVGDSLRGDGDVVERGQEPVPPQVGAPS